MSQQPQSGDANTYNNNTATDAHAEAPPVARTSSQTELTEEEILRTRSRAAITAIAIPQDESSDEDDDAFSSGLYAPSPGAHSTVSKPESWRPYPPPMLGSSFDSRQIPSLVPRERIPSISSQHPPAYGAAAVAAAADVLRQEVSTSATPEAGINTNVEAPPHYVWAPPKRTSTVGWRTKVARAGVQLRALGHAPRELFLVFALKLLSSYAYFSLSLILTTFLTDEFGLSDYEAGWAYGMYGLMSTFFGIICGWFIDYLGVRLALLLGGVVGAVSRLVITFTRSRHTARLILYTFLPFAECLGIPIMTIAIKRYTNSRNRTFAFSLFYSMMNVAALMAGPAVDISRGLFRNGVTWDLRFLGIEHVLRLTGLRIVVLSSAVATAAICVVVLFGIREVEVDASGTVQAFEPNRSSPIQQTIAVLQEAAFWRLTLFTFLLVGVRLVFRHLDATMPKYLVREFGENAPYGLMYAINPFLIIFLVPFVGLATRGVRSFDMILYGSFVAAISPFWICITSKYWTVILFMVTLSIGEAIYSPRVYEYTMEVSGRGNEGLYSSLSSAPLFSVKLLVGGMSGWLLTSFMSVDGPHHPKKLWGIIGLSSIISPILMYLLQSCIAPRDAEENGQGGAINNSSNVAPKRSRRVSLRTSASATPLEATPLVSAKRPPVWKASAPVEIEDDRVDFDDDHLPNMPMSAQSPGLGTSLGSRVPPHK